MKRDTSTSEVDGCYSWLRHAPRDAVLKVPWRFSQLPCGCRRTPARTPGIDGWAGRARAPGHLVLERAGSVFVHAACQTPIEAGAHGEAHSLGHQACWERNST